MTKKERIKKYLAAGLCRECGKLRVNSKIHCPECAEKARVYNRKWVIEHRAQHCETVQKRADKLRNEGKCTRCGKTLDSPTSLIFCSACLERRRNCKREQQKNRYWLRRAAGLCVMCGKPSARAVCPNCRAKYYKK